MCMDLVENISEAEEDYNRTYSEESDEFLPKSENTVPVTSRNIFGIIAILSILTLAMTITGSSLIHYLRKYYKENYYEHSHSISWSIALVFFSNAALIAWNSIRICHHNDIIEFEKNFALHDSWKYPLCYLAMEVLGQYFPIAL